MGQIIIKIPQSGVHNFQISNGNTVKKLLSELERLAAQDSADEDEDILGLWTKSPNRSNKRLSNEVFQD